MRFTIRSRASVLALAVAAGLALTTMPAVAGTATSNLSVTSSISANCTISSTAVAFGAYDPANANASTALTGTGSVSTTCTNGASATISLGNGGNYDSTNSVRQMTDGATTPHLMQYNLYTDNTYATVWNATNTVAVTGTGSAVSSTVYGKIPAGQSSLPSGSYSDTVVATVTF